MNARMSDAEWMQHMQGRLRVVQVLCIVAIVAAVVGVVW